MRFHPQHVTGLFLFLYVITSFGLLLANTGGAPSPGRLHTTRHRDSDAEASLVFPLLPLPGWAAQGAQGIRQRGVEAGRGDGQLWTVLHPLVSSTVPVQMRTRQPVLCGLQTLAKAVPTHPQ